MVIGVSLIWFLRPILKKSRAISVEVSGQAGRLQESIIEYVQNGFYFKATEQSEPVLSRISSRIRNLGDLDFRLSLFAAFSKSISEPIHRLHGRRNLCFRFC